MEKTATTYADVLLPLPLTGTYSYALPPALAPRVQRGSRVLVSFGVRKFYTGIVVRLHDHKPAGDFTVKPVDEVMDEQPVLLPPQLDFWQWLSSYYLASPGEVMRAALPAGLKLESETTVRLNADYDGDAPAGATEAAVVRALEGGQAVRLDALKRQVGGSGVLPAVRRLVERGAVRVDEALARAFKPRTETRVRLTEAYASEEALTRFFDTLTRSPRQEALLTTYLEMSQAAAALTLHNLKLLREVAKKDLMARVGGSEAALGSLREKGVLETYQAATERLQPHAAPERLVERPLSEAQQAALDGIASQLRERRVCLLQGVTSSGKTEIYIRLIRRELEAGRQVLYLLPEIALTTQITARLGRVFGDRMGVYHSKFPDAERVELWQRQLTDRAFPLILGVRSALFLPFQRLGLIIVDEEHEASYKQQDPAPRYHARDAAIVLAGLCGAKVLLGTATPSLETYHNATAAGKYGLVRLTERYGNVQLPEIVVEDVKELRRKKLMKTPFAPRLLDEMRSALARREQVILFQNRRGYAPVLECSACGWTPRCTACDVTLTYHQRIHKLVCHYCGATYDVPERCPNCQEATLRDVGYGTERIEEAVQACFPEARTARLDLDTTRSRMAYEQILDNFQRGRTDILIGTQMVTKGLDFDRVSVVGILNADQMLNQPDFRAHERAYAMMAQVAGRAGRRGKRGLVILQTRQPDLPLIQQVVENNYEAMYACQLAERRTFGFPPAVRLIDVYLKHRDEAVCEHAAQAFAALLRPTFGNDLLGPERPVVGRIQRLFIRKIMLRLLPERPAAATRRLLLAARQQVLATPGFSAVNMYFDVDPL